MDYFHLSEDKQDILKMSNLGLAYLGDAVYEVERQTERRSPLVPTVLIISIPQMLRWFLWQEQSCLYIQDFPYVS